MKTRVSRKEEAMKNAIVISLGLILVLTSHQVSSSKDKVERIHNGVQLETGDLNVKAQFYSTNIVRVMKWLPEATLDTSSLVVIQKTLPHLDISVTENDKTITLRTGTLELMISKNDGAVEYRTNNDERILREDGKAIITPTDVGNEKAYSIKQRFELTPDEGIYGLGQHQYGFMNYRGRTVKLVQTNTDAVIPFMISTRNFGIYWDNYSKTIFEDNNNGTSLWSDVASNIDYYFVYGSTMDSVIAGYRYLTGQAPMYGKWAYG